VNNGLKVILLIGIILLAAIVTPHPERTVGRAVLRHATYHAMRKIMH
jgi:hypothetical protein